MYPSVHIPLFERHWRSRGSQITSLINLGNLIQKKDNIFKGRSPPYVHTENEPAGFLMLLTQKKKFSTMKLKPWWFLKIRLAKFRADCRTTLTCKVKRCMVCLTNVFDLVVNSCFWSSIAKEFQIVLNYPIISWFSVLNKSYFL